MQKTIANLVSAGRSLQDQADLLTSKQIVISEITIPDLQKQIDCNQQE